jgi:hypothetical protein
MKTQNPGGLQRALEDIMDKLAMQAMGVAKCESADADAAVDEVIISFVNPT